MKIDQLHTKTKIAHWIFAIQPIFCWQQWNFSSHTNDDWRELWTLAEGPGARRGHTLVLFNQTKLILFGGRGNDAHRPHVPKRFDVVDVDGVLEFSTHDGVPLSTDYSPYSPRCQPVETCVPLTNASSGNKEVCSYSWDHLLLENPNSNAQAKIEEACGYVPAGVYYNDVWVYDTDCLRYDDQACAFDGWKLLHEGKSFGGCNEVEGEIVCDIPSERFGHGATMVGKSMMAVYGGYSNECEDYCDDLWMFDLMSLQWTEVKSAINPGNRWQFSMVGSVGSEGSSIYLFGGHRLWHGMAPDNSAANRWQSNELLPKGGYLNDLWVYTSNQSNENQEWVKVEGKPTCVDAPGLTWESRNDKQCKVHWPTARSGHAAVYDDKRKGMWVHGGFSTYYPYPTSTSAGSGLGTQSLGNEHVALQPTHAFYLDDLWFYDVRSGYWEKKQIFGRKPQRRTDHILSLTGGNQLVLHGGFGDNIHFNDTWHYIMDENRWLKKDHFVHASYPDSSCTDDLAAVQLDPTCIELDFPSDLKRSNESTLALKYQEVLPFSQQRGYTPDSDHPFYFGIVDNAEELVQELRRKYLDNEVYDGNKQRIWLESTVPDGTPIAPKAASAPRQYARMKRMKYNQTTELGIWEWCTSVKGEPTRGRADDNMSVVIPQPRRRAPGWDGCRDITWKYPPSRADHASVYVDKFDMLVAHGGRGYFSDDDSKSTTSSTISSTTRVLGDLWVLNMHNCASNCSGHGVCTNGFCKCDPGYFGVDCSNITCPGSVCEYDDNYAQHCKHCCYDSVDGRKVPCSLMDEEQMIFSGTSDGICDGFGTCQCAPPYIGEDCSILDCKHNCNFNGYCMVEFPQSRCMCKDGYTGEYCQHLECLNNCSYPNGICNRDTGKCSCNTLYSPYNRTKPWLTWGGVDCSYLPAWSGAAPRATSFALIFSLLSSIKIILSPN